MDSRPRRVLWLILMLVGVLVAFSCHRDTSGDRNAKQDQGIHRKFENGPVTLLLSTDCKELTIADRLNLRIEVIAGEAYEVKLPGIGEKLDQFGIVDYHTSQPELMDGGKAKITRSYVLEPFLSGDYTIPSMKVRFREKNKKNAKDHVVETEPLTIRVKSLLPAKAAHLKIHEIKPPVAMPGAWTSRVWAAGGIGIVAALLGGLFWYRRRGRVRHEADLIIPAHERAFRELEELLAENLTARGETKLFYQRVSDILRHYIEGRFGIPASGQTTQEFLEGLRSSDVLNKQYRPLLKTFLQHCDLVKFAEFQPATQDVRETFDSCKAFIMGTGEGEA